MTARMRLIRERSINAFISEASDVDMLEAKRLFSVIDSDGSGKIDNTKMRNIFADLGVNVTDREIDDLMMQLDKDGDGVVTFDDWKKGILFIQRAFGLDSSSPRPTARAPIPQKASGSSFKSKLATIVEEPEPVRRATSTAHSHTSSTEVQQLSHRKSKKKSKKTSGKLKLTEADTDYDSAASLSQSQSGTKKITKPVVEPAPRKPSAESTNYNSGASATSHAFDDELSSSSASSSSSSSVSTLSSSGASPISPPSMKLDVAPIVEAVPPTPERKRSSVAHFVEQLTPNQYSDIENLFRFHDRDGIGRVPLTSLEEIIRTVDPDLSARDVKVMMAQVDTEGQPDVGFQQFMRSMHCLFKALRMKKALNKERSLRPDEQAYIQRKISDKRNTLGRDTLTREPRERVLKQEFSNADSGSLFDQSVDLDEQTASVDEALWRHVEMLEDELAAARQEILLLSKLTKARRRESVLLSDPTQMAALLVRMAQRDGEMGEKASAALCSAICVDERLVRRIVRQSQSAAAVGSSSPLSKSPKRLSSRH